MGGSYVRIISRTDASVVRQRFANSGFSLSFDMGVEAGMSDATNVKRET